MDIVSIEVNNYFRPELTVYKFVGNIHELQHVVRCSMSTLFIFDSIYFSVNEEEIPKNDSRFSVYRAGVV